MSTADNARFGQVEIDVTDTAQQFPITAGSTGGTVVKANIGNGSPLYLGSDNTVTNTTGFELNPGDGLQLEILNLGRLWIYGASGDTISWASVNA